LDVNDKKLSRGGLFDKFIFLFGLIFATNEFVELYLLVIIVPGGDGPVKLNALKGVASR
jgi:hypothetical protein